jgi:hypothetical protein
VADLDEPAVLERAERLAHGDAAGADVARELPLGRQLVTALEGSIVDRALEVRDDLLVDSRHAHRRRHGARHSRPKRERSQAGGRARNVATSSA